MENATLLLDDAVDEAAGADLPRIRVPFHVAELHDWEIGHPAPLLFVHAALLSPIKTASPIHAGVCVEVYDRFDHEWVHFHAATMVGEPAGRAAILHRRYERLPYAPVLMLPAHELDHRLDAHARGDPFCNFICTWVTAAQHGVPREHRTGATHLLFVVNQAVLGRARQLL